ncbi:uncharacterized protein LOC118479518 [Helianthus annuus]|uniref:uncharacterized protein LOC118479518 n=1 Tax=Helianthus annuus TaxID=4232 RepID=UPI001652E8B1|nr:uncharacterized protein LOC118479518 [Helianthus annuus]
MKTILRSCELWDVVYLGITATSNGDDQHREAKKKDAQAMAIIQRGVDDQLFSRIVAAKSAKDTWETLRMEFQGDSQVQAVKLQSLRREFENFNMKDDEVVGEYFSRVTANISLQRAFGEKVSDQKVVEKILRSLSPKFDYVIPSIEVALDLSTIKPVKLMGMLQSQEERLNGRTIVSPVKPAELTDEKALQVFQDNNKSTRRRGRGRTSFRGRGRGRPGSGMDRSKVPQCYICKKFRHLQKDCWYNEEPQVNVAEDEETSEPAAAESEAQHLLMAFVPESTKPMALMVTGSHSGKLNHLWFIDSGCSNHMIGSRNSFVSFDDTFTLDVILGDKKKVAVKGKGTIKVYTSSTSFKLLDDVYYAPQLEYNLLSQRDRKSSLRGSSGQKQYVYSQHYLLSNCFKFHTN